MTMGNELGAAAPHTREPDGQADHTATLQWTQTSARHDNIHLHPSRMRADTDHALEPTAHAGYKSLGVRHLANAQHHATQVNWSDALQLVSVM